MLHLGEGADAVEFLKAMGEMKKNLGDDRPDYKLFLLRNTSTDKMNRHAGNT